MHFFAFTTLCFADICSRCVSSWLIDVWSGKLDIHRNHFEVDNDCRYTPPKGRPSIIRSENGNIVSFCVVAHMLIELCDRGTPHVRIRFPIQRWDRSSFSLGQDDASFRKSTENGVLESMTILNIHHACRNLEHIFGKARSCHDHHLMISHEESIFED